MNELVIVLTVATAVLFTAVPGEIKREYILLAGLICLLIVAVTIS